MSRYFAGEPFGKDSGTHAADQTAGRQSPFGKAVECAGHPAKLQPLSDDIREPDGEHRRQEEIDRAYDCQSLADRRLIPDNKAQTGSKV